MSLSFRTVTSYISDCRLPSVSRESGVVERKGCQRSLSTSHMPVKPILCTCVRPKCISSFPPSRLRTIKSRCGATWMTYAKLRAIFSYIQLDYGKFIHGNGWDIGYWIDAKDEKWSWKGGRRGGCQMSPRIPIPKLFQSVPRRRLGCRVSHNACGNWSLCNSNLVLPHFNIVCFIDPRCVSLL